jgi:hypothetical protein
LDKFLEEHVDLFEHALIVFVALPVLSKTKIEERVTLVFLLWAKRTLACLRTLFSDYHGIPFWRLRAGTETINISKAPSFVALQPRKRAQWKL